MNMSQEQIDRLISMGILMPSDISQEDVKDKINNLYQKYISSRDKSTLQALIGQINSNMTHPSIRDFLELKIDNKSIFDVMIQLKIQFTGQAKKYICSQPDLLIKLLETKETEILNHIEEDDLFKEVNGITIFEYIIKNNLVKHFSLVNFKEKHNIIEILKKYNMEEKLKYSNENLMFEKYDENKLVIEYLLENDLLSPYEVEHIKHHPEVVDYIIKYNKTYLLETLNHELLETKRNGKFVLEDVLENGINPIMIMITNDEVVDILLENQKYETLKGINIKHAFKKVPGSNMELFEFLLYHGIVSHNVLTEIYRNTKYANAIYEILKKHHNLNLLSNFGEDRMLLKYGQDETLLETLLKQNQIITAMYYEHEESFNLLLKYNRYEELAKCSEELLMKELPNGKKLYEELIDRGIEIQTTRIKNQQIAKKIIDEKNVEQIFCLSNEVLLSLADLNETYLDKFIKILEEQPYLKKEKYLDIIDYMTSLDEKAKILIIFEKHNILKKISIEELLEERNGTTLLEELLKEDKKITINKILTDEVKSNPEVASILKLYGIKQKNIKYEIVNRNLAEEYTRSNIEELQSLPVIPEYERLLQELFMVMNDGYSDVDLITALVASYRYLLSTNNQFANEIMHLINLKKQEPSFTIEKSKDKSYYNGGNLTIGLESQNISVLNHEVSHALHGMIDSGSIPKGFEELIKKERKSIKRHLMVSIFSKKYSDLRKKIFQHIDRVIMKEYDKSITEEDKIKIQEYLDTLNTKQRELYEQKGYTKQLLDTIFDRTFTVDDYLKQTRKIQREEMYDRIIRTEYPYMAPIGDYFDAIYEGKCYDGKMCDVLGLVKLPGISGHGIDYYKDNTQAMFNEMIANYGTIMKSKNPKEGIEMLRYFIGDELVSMVAQHYIQNIYYNYSYLQVQNQSQSQTI